MNVTDTSLCSDKWFDKYTYTQNFISQYQKALKKLYILSQFKHCVEQVFT